MSSVGPVTTLIVAAILFAAMATLAKHVAAGLPGPEIAFVRFIVGLCVCGAAAPYLSLKANNKVGLLMRGVYGGSAVLLYFLAIEHLPVGIATLLNYTAPVFSALYAGVVLAESLAWLTVGALALTTLGVALVILGSAPPGSLALGAWQIVGIGSAICSGAAVATIRQVRRTDGAWEIFIAFCAAGALVCLPQTLIYWVTPSVGQALELVGVGLLSVLAQLLMTYALRWVRAALAGVIAQLTPVASLALGWFLFDERLGTLALLGAALTLVGVTLGARYAALTHARSDVTNPAE
ncbi:MAG TPA: DMT family transporter [Polyangiaceae bacterium]|nr:DMT family transporter [Polyangiaceae bacterium]